MSINPELAQKTADALEAIENASDFLMEASPSRSTVTIQQAESVQRILEKLTPWINECYRIRQGKQSYSFQRSQR